MIFAAVLKMPLIKMEPLIPANFHECRLAGALSGRTCIMPEGSVSSVGRPFDWAQGKPRRSREEDLAGRKAKLRSVIAPSTPRRRPGPAFERPLQLSGFEGRSKGAHFP